MQLALAKTLELLGGETRELLLLYLSERYRISTDGVNLFTAKDLETALETLFGKGAEILIRRFNEEYKRKTSLKGRSKHGTIRSKEIQKLS